MEWKGTATETDVSGQVNILQTSSPATSAGSLSPRPIPTASSRAPRRPRRRDPCREHRLRALAQTPPLVATNNVAAGAKAADILAKLIGGSGQVALLPFVPSAATSAQRQQGFEQELKKYRASSWSQCSTTRATSARRCPTRRTSSPRIRT